MRKGEVDMRTRVEGEVDARNREVVAVVAGRER
jgi:hypothetical protein